MREKAIHAMIQLGIQANTKGFTYIADAMELLEKDEELRFHTCRLYEEIAKLHEGANKSRVERAIRNSFQYASTNACLEDMERYLTTAGRQSNGNLLAVFYLKLKRG